MRENIRSNFHITNTCNMDVDIISTQKCTHTSHRIILTAHVLLRVTNYVHSNFYKNNNINKMNR